MLTRSALLLLTSILVIGSLLTGCTPRQGAATVGERDGDLSLGLWVSRTQVEGGEPIELRFTVKNIGDSQEVIRLEDRPAMDIWIGISTATGWVDLMYWSDEREITPEMKTLVLAPGEVKTIEMRTWTSREGHPRAPVLAEGILRRAGGGETRVQISICVGNCGRMD